MNPFPNRQEPLDSGGTSAGGAFRFVFMIFRYAVLLLVINATIVPLLRWWMAR